jgi:hypothetical protein
MKKKPLPIEFILLAFSFVITGIAVLFVFKPPAKDFVKLIKWSPESSIEGVLENSARRLYPILAESKNFKVEALKDLDTQNEEFKAIFNKITNLDISIDSDIADQFNISNDKQRTFKLIVLATQVKIQDLQSNLYYDSFNLEKLIVKFKSNEFNGKNIIFSLYQTGRHEFTLNILKL